MNILLLQLKQALAKAKADKREIEIKVKRNLVEIQSYLNPYFMDWREIKAEEIEQAGDELLILKQKLAETDEKIIELEAALN